MYPKAVCRHIKTVVFSKKTFCMIDVSYSLHLHSGEKNSSEKLLGRVASAGFSE